MSSPHLSDTAVLINEFGEIGLDHLLITSIDEEVMLLESGCVCCNVKDDFSRALLDLYEKRDRGIIPNFERVILETTGIADPVAIHQMILADPDVNQRFQYGKTITVVDAIFGVENLNQFAEAVNQVAIADHLIVAKMDLADENYVTTLKQRLNALNPTAKISEVARHDDQMDELDHIFRSPTHPENLQKIPQQPNGKNHHTGKEGNHDGRFSTYCLRWNESVMWIDFEAWLEGLLAVRGDNILRLKGLVWIEGEQGPTVIHGVQHSFYPPEKLKEWPRAKPQTELVFITRDFSKIAAMRSFEEIFTVQVI